MKVLCLYHNADLDGKCSGAIVKKWAESNGHELVLHGMNYGYETPRHLIKDADQVIISDFSLPLVDMVQIVDKLTWYDHHISAIKEMQDIKIPGIQDTKRAGCELTWMGLFPNRLLPPVVTMLGAYDTWMWKQEPVSIQTRILNLQYGMRLDSWWPDDSDWKLLLSLDGDIEYENKLMGCGHACIKYQAQMMERINPSGRLIDWEGYNWFTVNCHQTASTNFEEYIKDLDVQGVIAYHLGQDGTWKYSLRSFSDDLDVSVICKKHGGGGHAGAGGFATGKLLGVLT